MGINIKEIFRRSKKEIPEIQEDLIVTTIQEYKKGPLTPELVNETWQTLWKAWGERINHTFTVPICDRTTEELFQLQKEGRAVLLIPDEICTQKGLAMLGEIFPKMRSEAASEKTTIVNETDKGGCIDVEIDIKTPNRSTTEDDLRENFSQQERSGQRLATYIVASQLSKLLTGRYFDSTVCRLLGSLLNNTCVTPWFGSGGDLHVRWGMNPNRQRPWVGGRSEGRKKSR